MRERERERKREQDTSLRLKATWEESKLAMTLGRARGCGPNPIKAFLSLHYDSLSIELPYVVKYYAQGPFPFFILIYFLILTLEARVVMKINCWYWHVMNPEPFGHFNAKPNHCDQLE